MGDAETDRSGRSAVYAAALGAILPGLGHGYLGRWLRAALMFLPFVALLVLAYVALRMRSLDLLAMLVRPSVLRGILIVNVAVVVWRVFAVADPYRISRGKRSVGALVTVAVLSVVVAAPHVLIARYTLDAAYLLDEVFVTNSDVDVRVIEEFPSESAGALFAPGDSAIVEVADPSTLPREARSRSVRNLIFRVGIGDPEAVANSVQYSQHGDRSLRTLVGSDAEGVERITILLAGGDGGPGRSGRRTDSIMVATFDTTTGKAVAFGIPRNMTHVPLPDEWATAFVELEKRLIPWDERRTWTDDDGDGEPDQFVPCDCFPDQINSIYPFTRKWYETYPNEVDPGLAALRDTLEIMLGIEIDYYAMIDMDGFVRLVDALGGVRAYLTSSVQADVSPAREGEDWIEIDLSPGWNRLNGHEALAYVRERRSTSDYMRMERQRCLLKAVAAETDATTVVRRFSAISRAVAASVKTDINIDYLPTLLGYAASLDFNDIATIGFVPPYYSPEVDFRGKPMPDLNRIQAMVRWALNAEHDTEFVSGRDSECRI